MRAVIPAYYYGVIPAVVDVPRYRVVFMALNGVDVLVEYVFPSSYYVVLPRPLGELLYATLELVAPDAVVVRGGLDKDVVNVLAPLAEEWLKLRPQFEPYEPVAAGQPPNYAFGVREAEYVVYPTAVFDAIFLGGNVVRVERAPAVPQVGRPPPVESVAEFWKTYWAFRSLLL